MKKLILITALTSCIANAQIPVTDGIQIGENMNSSIIKIGKAVAQLNKLKEQYTQMQKSYKAITGNVMSTIAKIKNLKENLKFSSEDIQNMILTGDFSKIPGGNELKKKYEIKDICDGNKACETKKNKIYGAMAAMQSISETLNTKLATLDNLTAQVNSAKSLKEINDINAGINSQVASIQIIKLKMDLMQNQREIDKEIQAQRRAENQVIANEKSLKGTEEQMNRIAKEIKNSNRSRSNLDTVLTQ